MMLKFILEKEIPKTFIYIIYNIFWLAKDINENLLQFNRLDFENNQTFLREYSIDFSKYFVKKDVKMKFKLVGVIIIYRE